MWIKYITYVALLLSVLSLWLPVKTTFKPWQLFLCIALGCAIFSGIANSIAILSILIFYCLVILYCKCSTAWKWFWWGLVFALGLALELHLIPGFHNLLVLNKIQLSPDAILFSLYLNLDKTVVGIIILGLTLNLANTIFEWKTLLAKVLYILPIVILTILVLSFAYSYVKFDPKIPQYLWIWVISNLFFTCVAEEGFFRGFFQETLSRSKYKYSEYIAILVPAVFFGLIHYKGGLPYIILAIVAGILYGWIYHVTKRVEASIITHFLLNLTHVLFFTYPALLQ